MWLPSSSSFSIKAGWPHLENHYKNTVTSYNITYIKLSQSLTVLSTQLKYWLLIGKHFTFFFVSHKPLYLCEQASRPSHTSLTAFAFHLGPVIDKHKNILIILVHFFHFWRRGVNNFICFYWKHSFMPTSPTSSGLLSYQLNCLFNIFHLFLLIYAFLSDYKDLKSFPS